MYIFLNSDLDIIDIIDIIQRDLHGNYQIAINKTVNKSQLAQLCTEGRRDPSPLHSLIVTLAHFDATSQKGRTWLSTLPTLLNSNKAFLQIIQHVGTSYACFNNFNNVVCCHVVGTRTEKIWVNIATYIYRVSSMQKVNKLLLKYKCYIQLLVRMAETLSLI